MAIFAKITLKSASFKNPTRLIVFRVNGSVDSERLQKNFLTKLSARTFMNGLIRVANQGESSPERNATTTFETDAELRAGELAWQRLRQQWPKGCQVTAVDQFGELG